MLISPSNLITSIVVCSAVVFFGSSAHAQNQLNNQEIDLEAPQFEIDRSILGVFPEERVELNINANHGESQLNDEDATSEFQFAINRNILGVMDDEYVSLEDGSILLLDAYKNKFAGGKRNLNSGLSQLNALLTSRSQNSSNTDVSQANTSDLTLENEASGSENSNFEILDQNETPQNNTNGISTTNNAGGELSLASLDQSLNQQAIDEETINQDDSVNAVKPIEYKIAKLNALDKITAKVSRFSVKVGSNFSYGSLEGKILSCQALPPTEPPHSGAFVQISDKNNNQKLYSGWMFAESPGLTGLEHPVYVIWLNSCDQPLITNPLDELQSDASTKLESSTQDEDKTGLAESSSEASQAEQGQPELLRLSPLRQ